jgi:hypothetical protein
MLLLVAVSRIYRLGTLKWLWNDCLPNYVDFRISTHIGPLYVSLIEIETDCEYMNYRPRLEPYQPRFALVTFHWEKSKHSHFNSERSLIGYQLSSYPSDESTKKKPVEDEYWHIVSILFYDFWFRADGPLKLYIDP